MLLCIDIGNTNVVVGAFDGEQLSFQFRLKTDLRRTVDEYRALLHPLIFEVCGANCVFDASIISSVVPPLTQAFKHLVQDCFKLDAMIVGPGIRTGISINLSDPRAVGADRVVNAVALKELYGVPGLVIDFGTATSFDFVSEKGCYEGGVIAPGIGTAVDALVRNTAKLPRIELAWPDSVIGKGTVAAMQSGTVMGYVCMVDGLVEKIVEEVGAIDHIVATGGFGLICTQHSKMVRRYEEHLTLRGMKIVADLNL